MATYPATVRRSNIPTAFASVGSSNDFSNYGAFNKAIFTTIGTTFLSYCSTQYDTYESTPGLSHKAANNLSISAAIFATGHVSIAFS